MPVERRGRRKVGTKSLGPHFRILCAPIAAIRAGLLRVDCLLFRERLLSALLGHSAFAVGRALPGPSTAIRCCCYGRPVMPLMYGPAALRK
jgi:hypothetical protein